MAILMTNPSETEPPHHFPTPAELRHFLQTIKERNRQEEAIRRDTCPKCGGRMIETPVITGHELFSDPNLRFCVREGCGVVAHRAHAARG
jgi:hypothetical protein